VGTLTLMMIKRLYEQLIEEMKDGGFVDCVLDVISNAWYEILFNSQFNTDIELYGYFIRSGIDVDVEVFKRGWSWYGRGIEGGVEK